MSFVGHTPGFALHHLVGTRLIAFTVGLSRYHPVGGLKYLSVPAGELGWRVLADKRAPRPHVGGAAPTSDAIGQNVVLRRLCRPAAGGVAGVRRVDLGRNVADDADVPIQLA